MSEGKRQEAKVQAAHMATAPGPTPPPAVEAPASDAREEDRRLVAQAKAGDKAAFGTLLRRYERRVFSVANAMLRNADDAKDVSQEAFWKAHNALASFDGSSQFFTWMYRITVNLSIDYLRKRRGERVEFDDARANGEGEAGDPTGISPRRLGMDPARALADRELREQLDAALAQLSPAHRAVLTLREVEGLSYQEMADVVGCSIGTIMSRLFHARKKMQALLIAARGADNVPHVSDEAEEGKS
jgi:RNA polymerase sigma-70 factor (ECF subfamily)